MNFYEVENKPIIDQLELLIPVIDRKESKDGLTRSIIDKLKSSSVEDMSFKEATIVDMHCPPGSIPDALRERL